jgi:hypothetical protein
MHLVAWNSSIHLVYHPDIDSRHIVTNLNLNPSIFPPKWLSMACWSLSS